LIRKVHKSTKQSKERTLLVDGKCHTKVYLRKARYHCFELDNSKSDCKEVKLCTSKLYTVVNLGCEEVKLVAAEGDSFGCDKHLVLKGGKKVTIQNYKNTFYVVA